MYSKFETSPIFRTLAPVNQVLILPTHGKIQFSEHAVLYDMLIPKNHLLRQINELIDYRFIYDELVSKYCLDNGRIAVD